MKTKLNEFAIVAGLCLMTVLPLRAQLEAGTNGAAKASEAVMKQALDNDQELEKKRLETQKDIAESENDSRRSMVHDVFWSCSTVVLVTAIFFFGYLRDKRRHETIRLMIEKGSPMTPELLDGLRKKSRLTVHTNYDRHGYLCWGITLMAVGIVLVAAFHGGAHLAGLIVLAVGVANLILWFIDRAHPNGGQTK